MVSHASFPCLRADEISTIVDMIADNRMMRVFVRRWFVVQHSALIIDRKQSSVMRACTTDRALSHVSVERRILSAELVPRMTYIHTVHTPSEDDVRTVKPHQIRRSLQMKNLADQ